MEFERRVPDRLIEEEQARTDGGAGDAGFQVKQRILQINVEIGDARQHPRRLPSVEPVPGGHEAELAIKLAQRQLRQSLVKCFAIVSLRAILADQQMSSSFPAVAHSLAPGNPELASFKVAPILHATQTKT